MAVQLTRARTGWAPLLAGAAVAADVLGRLLAPSLLKRWPLLVVGLSPSDPHMLLARVEPGALLVGVVLVVRVGRALLVFRATRNGMERIRSEWLRRLVAPARRNRWGDRSAVVGVILLPGMAGAVVAGRQRMRPPLFVTLLTLSTIAGVVLTLTAAAIFAVPLHAAGAWIAHRSAPVTLAVAIAIPIGLARRLRHRPAQETDQRIVDIERMFPYDDGVGGRAP